MNFNKLLIELIELVKKTLGLSKESERELSAFKGKKLAYIFSVNNKILDYGCQTGINSNRILDHFTKGEEGRSFKRTDLTVITAEGTDDKKLTPKVMECFIDKAVKAIYKKRPKLVERASKDCEKLSQYMQKRYSGTFQELISKYSGIM